jgi:hypothetical protein
MLAGVADDTRDQVLQQLRSREPLFHHRNLVHEEQSFDVTTVDDFWEVGASGRVYPRDVVRRTLVERWRSQSEDDLVTERWSMSDVRVRMLCHDTYLFTYRLHQADRVTRRATIWERGADGAWRVVYHQGTIVAGA